MMERLTPEEGCQIDDKLEQIFQGVSYEDHPHFGEDTAFRIAERIPRFYDHMPGNIIYLQRRHVDMTLAPLVTPIEGEYKESLLDMQKTAPLNTKLSFQSRNIALHGVDTVADGFTLTLNDTRISGWLQFGEQERIVVPPASYVRVWAAAAQHPHLLVAHIDYNADNLQLDGESFIHADTDCVRGGCYYDASPASSAAFLITADGEPKSKVLMRILDVACVLRQALADAETSQTL